MPVQGCWLACEKGVVGRGARIPYFPLLAWCFFLFSEESQTEKRALEDEEAADTEETSPTKKTKTEESEEQEKSEEPSESA